MKTVKIYLNSAEAGFASSLLEAGGIRTLLHGEQSFALTPGFASGGIQLQVPDEDFEKALIILRDGPDAVETESAPAEEGTDEAAIAEEPPPEAFEPETPAPDPQAGTGKIPAGVFVAAVVVLALLSFFLVQRSKDHKAAFASYTTSADFGDDGKPDHFDIYREGRLVRQEVDRNGDGVVDAWYMFNSQGRTESTETDENFDGRVDGWAVFKQGELQSWKRDLDYDGVPDAFGDCKRGQTVECDMRPGDSWHPLRRYLYTNEILKEELVDENGDGLFDYKFVYDIFGTRSGRRPVRDAQGQ